MPAPPRSRRPVPPAAPPPTSSPPAAPPPPPIRVIAEPGGVRAEVALLRGEVRAVADQVRALGGEVRRQARTDWPALLTAGGLAVTVAVGLGALALDPLEAAAARDRADAADLRAAQRGLNAAVRTHLAGSHPAAEARLGAPSAGWGRWRGGRDSL